MINLAKMAGYNRIAFMVLAVVLLVSISAVTIALDDTDNVVADDHPTEIQYRCETIDGKDVAFLTTANRYLNLENVVIPETVISNHKTYTVIGIDDYAFGAVKDKYPFNNVIKSVSIPSTVKSIGIYAFAHCVNLTSVQLSEGLETISKFAFYRTPIGSLTIPESVIEIQQSICEECLYLKTVDVRTDAALDRFCFKKCISLESAIVNANSMERSAFGECPALKYVKIMEDATALGDFVFNGDENLFRIEFPDSLETLPPNIFFETSREDSSPMFPFKDVNGYDIDINAENLKGKIWQKFDDYFAQVCILTLDGNGGTLNCDAEQYIRVNSDLSISAPSRLGYIDGGWEPALPEKMPSTNWSSKAVWLVEVPLSVEETYEKIDFTPYHDETAYTFSGQLTRQDVGNYTVIATLTNPGNSCWADNRTSVERPINWEIKPKQVIVTADKPIEKKVGGADPDFKTAVSVKNVIEGDTIVYSATCLHEELIGTYVVTVSGNETQGNYQVSFLNGNVFKINGTEIHKPVAKTGLVYDGQDHYGIENGPGYELTGEIKEKQSTAFIGHAYKVTVAIKEGFQWKESPKNRASFDVTWTIAQ